MRGAGAQNTCAGPARHFVSASPSPLAMAWRADYTARYPLFSPSVLVRLPPKLVPWQSTPVPPLSSPSPPPVGHSSNRSSVPDLKTTRERDTLRLPYLNDRPPSSTLQGRPGRGSNDIEHAAGLPLSSHQRSCGSQLQCSRPREAHLARLPSKALFGGFLASHAYPPPLGSLPAVPRPSSSALDLPPPEWSVELSTITPRCSGHGLPGHHD